MNEQSGLLQRCGLEVLRGICERNGVGLCYLFGSQAQNAHRMLLGERVHIEDPLTDIDVGVVLLHFDRLQRAGELHLVHSRLYGAMVDLFVPYEPDVVLLQENHSVFQLEAIRGICVFEASASFRSDYEEMVLRKGADFRYVLETYLRERTADLGARQGTPATMKNERRRWLTCSAASRSRKISRSRRKESRGRVRA